MRRIAAGVNVHWRRVLTTLLFTVVHFIDGCAVTIQVVVLDGRRDTGHDGEQIRLLKGEAQRPLSAHADAEKTDGRRFQMPTLFEVGHYALKQMTFRRYLRVEFGTDAVGPPTTAAVRTDASKVQFVEEARESWPVAQR